MSDNIPFDIQLEIIKRLPVKSVVQCRSVSKGWKSLIDSPKFITSYHSCKTHIFVIYKLGNLCSKQKLVNHLRYVSIADDDTFPNHKSFLTLPQPISQLATILSLTSVNGLLCFYGCHRRGKRKNIAVLWNPSIRKTVSITISNSLRLPDGLTFIGFGVSPNTSDPKLVRINNIGFPIVLNWEVEVFALSARVWKSISSIPPAFKSCVLMYHHVCIDGFIYWLAYDSIKLAEGIKSDLIISFDLKNDEFGDVSLPDRLGGCYQVTISKVYESLGLFLCYNEGETKFCDVWIIKEGVTKSFTKMLTIKAPEKCARFIVSELRKNGEVIIENLDDRNSPILEVYEPSSGRITGVGINGTSGYFSVNSYMETLLLLDESNSIIH